jgi:urea transport system substrate-binding protein
VPTASEASIVKPCQPIAVLTDLVLGALEPETKASTEKHLEGCENCRTIVERMRQWSLNFTSKLGDGSTHPFLTLDAIVSEDTKASRPEQQDANQVILEQEAWRRCLAPPVQPNEIGRLNQYRIIRVIGRGGMGIVFEAEDITLLRPVALKLLWTGSSISTISKERFLQEAQTVARLRDDHIVTLHQVGEFAGVPYLVMELLQGVNLDDHNRKRGQLPVLEVVHIARQVAEGLAVAHANKLIHRDIKPANIWLEPLRHSHENLQGHELRVKLLDFGLARIIDQNLALTATGKVVGTPHYMAPEQAQGVPHDQRSDLFSLGCVIYQMLAGTLPFAGESVVQVLMAINTIDARDISDFRNDVPPDLARLVEQLLEKEPQKRPKGAEQVADILSRLESALGKGHLPLLEKKHSRRQWLAVVGGTAVGIATLGGLASFFLRPADGNIVNLPTGIPIKVGVLHSRTGTMTGAEKPVIEATLAAINEINQSGGVLGRPIEPVVVDGQSQGEAFASQAEKLITQQQVSAIFGCWTSASRKSVRPVVEKHQHLLLYPVQYEGLETSPNIIYLGAAPNQQIIPAVKWCVSALKKKHFFLVGSDYVFPRAANAIIKDQAVELQARIVGEEYALLGSTDFSTIVQKIKASQADVIINTINGDSNIAFFRALREARITSAQVPTVSMSVTEAELGSISTSDIVGEYAAWNYLESISSPQNQSFVKLMQNRMGQEIIVSDPMEAAYTGVHLWARAVVKAGSPEPTSVRTAMHGLTLQAPHGLVTLDPATQHLHKTIRIGKITEQGRLAEVYASEGPIAPVPFPGTRSKEAWEQYLNDLHLGWGGRWARPRE